MEKKPMLYVKLPNGRYQEYYEPVQEYDNKLYRKVGNKYVPCSMQETSNLDEGVWVVVRHYGHKSFTNGKYILDKYLCLKAGDIQDVSLSDIGGLERLTEHLVSHWEEIPRNVSRYDIARAIVGILYKYKNEQKS